MFAKQPVARGLALACVPLLALACGGSSGGAAGAYVYAGGGRALDVFAVDSTTGALTFQSMVAAGDDARLVEIDAPRGRAYLQTQIGNAVAIVSFDVDRASGTLRKTGEITLPHPAVEGITQIMLHPTAPWLLVSTTGGATGLEDQLLPVGDDGRLGAPKPMPIATEYYAFNWDRSGKYFFGIDGEALFQFVFDPATGALTPNDPPRVEASSGHAFITLVGHPGGKWFFSVEDTQLGRFALDAGKGTLTAEAYVRNPVPREPLYWTALAIHPAGRFLYALGHTIPTMIGLVDVFALDPTTGETTFLEREKGEPGHIVTSSGLQAPLVVGDFLIVGGRSATDALRGKPVLAVYRIAADGVLTPAGDPVELRPADSAEPSFVFSFGP